MSDECGMMNENKMLSFSIHHSSLIIHHFDVSVGSFWASQAFQPPRRAAVLLIPLGRRSCAAPAL